MKTKLYSLLTLFIMLPAVVMAGDVKGKFIKEKKISKTYDVNPNAGLDITNKYGNVYITTWGENKTSVEVHIKVSGNSEDKVNKRINSINVDFEAVKSMVIAKTNIGNFSGGKTSMEINYTVRIPKNGSINVNNQYGGIVLGKIYGESYIVCKYGDIKIEELNNKKNVIDIEYCGASRIGYINIGKITAKYSGVSVAKAEYVDLTSEYTDNLFQNADEVNYKCNYGEISITAAKKVFGVGNYLETKIGSLTGMLNLTTKYGNIKLAGLANSVKNLTINAEYTGIEVKYNENYAFDFEINLEYAGLEGTSGLKFTETREKPTRGYYKGYHKSSGNSRIFIDSKYGHLKLIKI